MAGETIRDIVERCYTVTGSGPQRSLLVPNELDQLNPNVPSGGSGGDPSDPSDPFGPGGGSSGPQPTDPGAIIRSLVDRCYSTPPPLEPNPLDPLYPPSGPPPGGGDPPGGPPPGGPGDPDPPPPLDPGEAIRILVDRCYPDPPVITPPPDPPPFTPPPTRPPLVPWIPWILIRTCPTCEIGPWITIDPPDPPTYPGIPTITRDPDDCDLVAKYMKEEKLRDLPDYEETRDGIVYKSPGWYEHIETGEKYYCKFQPEVDITWKECVRKAMECMFRPYIGGRWQPPKADCSAYWPNGWSGNLDEVCVKNCFPDRIPIYESYDSTGTLSVTFDASGQLVATGTGSAVIVLRLWWNDRVNTYGTAVSSIQIGSETWTQSGRSGEETKTITITGAGTTTVTFNGLNAANNPLTIVDNNTRLCLKDGGGSDCNANFSIVSTNLSGDHAYYSEGAKAGYTLTGNGSAGFYILINPIAGVTVPLFRFYSNAKHDTFLTTNPGMPDSPGTGERPMMNANGYGTGEVIGHVFPTAQSMSSYLAKGEQAEALHRFHSPNPFDHKYSIDGDFESGTPTKVPDLFCYRIPLDCKADLNVSMDVEKGDSGYNNALGFYLADETGPKYGRVVCTSARNGTEIYNAYIPNTKLDQYAGGTMGFFLMSDGADENTLTLNQEITFEPLNSPHEGGFRGIGINTAQSNYCLFSDKTWNPKKKDQTKWHGSDIQHWEDLIAGDDDYNDLRLWHRLAFTFGGYVYEGVQAYVYAKVAPEKIMRKVDPNVKCDTRILKASFKDVVLRRMDCGVKLPTFVGNDVEWECGECINDNTWYVNPASLAWRITDPDGGTSNVSATFDASGNLVTTGTGNATITFSFSWSDNPGTYGTALGTYDITSLGIQFTQGAGQSGSEPDQTVTIVGGQTYNCTITDGNAAGFDRTNGNQTLCFKDGDGTDCNATLSISGVTQQASEAEITNSLTEKGSWVQVGASNNPGNGWTQHMIDYGIYPAVPADTVVDPLIGEWQTHITSVNIPTSGVYTIRIESDNYGYIRLIDGSSNVIVDREISYNHGVGSETLNLSLDAGNYTLDTRVKNFEHGEYSIDLNRNQTIKAAVGGTFRVISMGGIAGGIMGSCMKFTIRVKKNGNEVFTEQFEAQYWPPIGGDLWDGDIILAPDDEFTFEVVSIDSGAVTGDIALEVGLFDLSTNMFDGVFKLMLGTSSHDGVYATTMGNPTNNPETAEGGEVEGFALAFRPTNRGDFEWEPGSKYDDKIPNPPAWVVDNNYAVGNRVLAGANIYECAATITYDGTQVQPTHTSGTTDSWTFIRVAPYPTWSEDNVPDPGYPYTYAWTGNYPVWMHGSLQSNPELPGASRVTGNPLMPHIPGGYCDTGYLYDKSEYFSATVLESYNYRNLTGVYNHLLEDFLFTRFETLSGNIISQSERDILVQAAPTTYARGAKPWYMLGVNVEDNKWYVNPATIAWRITDGATQIATSIEHKGSWVATGASNNPGNGWTQHMKDYGIYRVKPTDDRVDPYIGTWQVHTANVTFPTSTTYSIRIESDNQGWLKITDPNSQVIYDQEITYTQGAGGQTIPLTLSAGTYIIETRVNNVNVGSYKTVVNSIWDGSQQNPQRDTYYSPVTFIHDYTLDNYHGTGGSNYEDACKIRMGISFYPIIFDTSTSSKQVHYWQAMIHVIDVINKGKGYAKGSEFVLTWPPMRDRSAEDTSQTPYYPDQELGFSFPQGPQLGWWENDDLVRRSLKEAVYQESHNKNSVVWYSATDRAKFRVRFKVTLTQVTDPP